MVLLIVFIAWSFHKGLVASLMFGGNLRKYLFRVGCEVMAGSVELFFSGLLAGSGAQEFNTGLVPQRLGFLQRRFSQPVARTQVRLGAQECLQNLRMSFLRRAMHRCLVTTSAGIHVSPMGNQHFRNGNVVNLIRGITLRCEMQRRGAVFVACVHVSTVLEQHPQYGAVGLLCGAMQRGLVASPPRVQISAMSEQDLCDGSVLRLVRKPRLGGTM